MSQSVEGLRVRVARRDQLALDIVSFELVSADNQPLPAFEAGSHIDVTVPGGIGITPLLCMAERLSTTGRPFTLHYFARSAERAASVIE